MPPKPAQFTLQRRSFLSSAAALALAPLLPRAAMAGSVVLAAGRDPNTLIVLVDATVGNLDPATNLEWAYGLRPVYETLTVLDGTNTLQAAPDRKSTRLNSSHRNTSRMPSSA